MSLSFTGIKINAERFGAAGPFLVKFFTGMLCVLFTRSHRDAAFRLSIGGFPRQTPCSEALFNLLRPAGKNANLFI
ncbi:hypothetical protein NGUA33_03813 [Salmonella enterica]|nr:hypothetical protein NGUA33_03813 [Salmonella enterica]